MWNHNSFGDIVEGDGDFVGYVAYSLYKSRKVDWIKHYKEQHGDFPDVDVIKDFTSFHSKPDQIQKLRNEAEVMLNEYFDFSFSEELNQHKQALLESELLSFFGSKFDVTNTAIKRTKKKFWVCVGENIVATLMASLIIVGISFLLWFANSSPDHVTTVLRESPLPAEVKPE
ncbi:hypothetical protein [Vibrio fluvialis]|uniref:hypothetical protein n=1 Tax=Vibrio fluvialis TaxID=676 RepID=UPI001C9BF006|nr:hypothetical protein [Vibrio fluvialis]MBY7883431.1 hypothetical protein [Vibrio fluvialis]MBY7926316.1 hypothetical protein [Vibrio fluvialis]MCE7640156.1 hypothetical protein [Vibrio fluvialis]